VEGMGHGPDAGLVFALALGAGMLCQLLARHLRTPSIVLLLGAGVALGPDGLGWVVPRALGDGLLTIVSLAVAVILFEGGLNLDRERLQRAQRAIQLLVTVGAAITAVGAALAAHWVMDWEWRQALLFGTLVIVTGPTVIRPILRNVPLRQRLATVLEAEGVLIDPVGAIVAAVALEVVLVPAASQLVFGVPGLIARLLLGAVAGLGFGFVMGFVLRREGWVPAGLESLVTLGGVLVLFSGCNALLGESGILAVTLAGVVVGNLGLGHDLREFEERLTLALLGLLFVLLAADVRLADVSGLGWTGVATVGAVMFVVRPLNVIACTFRSGMTWREKAFLSWIGPRGIVAAAVASLAAVLMETGNLEGGPALRALVFLTIAITVVLQGGSAPLVARVLDVRAPARDEIAILGAEELGLALGDVLNTEKTNVVFVDANPENCQAAEARGFVAVYGNALDERVLARARLERCRAAVGLTANDQVNSLFAREAAEDFKVENTYVALAKSERGVTPRILAKQSSRLLFDGPKDVERWNVRFRHGFSDVRTFRSTGQPPPPEEAPDGATVAAKAARAGSGMDPFAVLAVCRGDLWWPMHAEYQAKAGDLARVALYRAEESRALEELAAMGWHPDETAVAEPAAPPG
jgi:NhaP-type Na+/H+ or K+/H+ antiporter